MRFRNVNVAPGAPVQLWPYEALVATLERGTVGGWVPVTRAIRDDRFGVVAQQVQEYLGYAWPYGLAPLLERAIVRARAAQEQDERAAVAAEVTELVQRSGLSAAELARRLGTSRSRLSTYRHGRVTPSAAFLVRLRKLVAGP